MKILSFVFAAAAALILSGCSSIPVPDKIDYTSNIVHLDKLDLEVESIPPSPNMKRIEYEGQVFGGFDLQGIDDLIYLREVARNNTEQLRTLVDLNNELIEERNHLVELSKELERLVNVMIGELYANEKSADYRSLFERIERLSYQISLIAVGSF